MSDLTINHQWAATPDPVAPVVIALTCQQGYQEAVFDSVALESKVLTGDGVCEIKALLTDSTVETSGDCGKLVNLTQDVTCNYQSVQFNQSVPMLSAWGTSMLVISMALVAAWWMRK